MGVQQNSSAVDEKVKNIFKKVLDIEPSEIKSAIPLAQSLGIDSTEMVEISVGLKKEFNIPIADNELKKTHTFEDIMRILKSKGVN